MNERCSECTIEIKFENSGNRTICKDCQIKTAIHKQVESEFGELIDEELVEIINVCYRYNIQTNNSCQEQTNLKHNGKTWICFNTVRDVELFIKLCKRSDELYKYILEQEWDIIVEPINITCTTMYEYSLRFPYKDLEYFKSTFINYYKYGSDVETDSDYDYDPDCSS